MSTSPSTADSQDAGEPVRPVVEKGGQQPSGTHSVVKGQTAPRLPHERDESGDSGTGAPSEVMHKAADDMADGHVDRPRGSQTQQDYSELTAQASSAPGGKTGGKTGGKVGSKASGKTRPG